MRVTAIAPTATCVVTGRAAVLRIARQGAVLKAIVTMSLITRTVGGWLHAPVTEVVAGDVSEKAVGGTRPIGSHLHWEKAAPNVITLVPPRHLAMQRVLEPWCAQGMGMMAETLDAGGSTAVHKFSNQWVMAIARMATGVVTGRASVLRTARRGVLLKAIVTMSLTTQTVGGWLPAPVTAVVAGGVSEKQVGGTRPISTGNAGSGHETGRDLNKVSLL